MQKPDTTLEKAPTGALVQQAEIFDALPPTVQERIMLDGDIAALKPAERVMYYGALCKAVGVSPAVKPFQVLELDGKTLLYPKKELTEALRASHGLSIVKEETTILEPEPGMKILSVTVYGKLPGGRMDQATAALPLVKENGEWKTSQSGKRYFQGNGTYSAMGPQDYANAVMKCQTKAKRRLTLSMLGLGFMVNAQIDDQLGEDDRADVMDLDEDGNLVGDPDDARLIRDKHGRVIEQRRSEPHAVPDEPDHFAGILEPEPPRPSGGEALMDKFRALQLSREECVELKRHLANKGVDFAAFIESAHAAGIVGLAKCLTHASEMASAGADAVGQATASPITDPAPREGGQPVQPDYDYDPFLPLANADEAGQMSLEDAQP